MSCSLCCYYIMALAVVYTGGALYDMLFPRCWYYCHRCPGCLCRRRGHGVILVFSIVVLTWCAFFVLCRHCLVYQFLLVEFCSLCPVYYITMLLLCSWSLRSRSPFLLLPWGSSAIVGVLGGVCSDGGVVGISDTALVCDSVLFVGCFVSVI